MGRIIMRPFSLKEYLKNPSRKVVTRDGRNVRIICTNAKGNFPIIALVETHNNTEVAIRLSEDGHFYNYAEDSSDLFFATEKQEGWINLFRDPTDNGIYCSRIYPTKERAMDSIGAFYTTIKVEWEE